MKKILLVGCGNIGFRHLQALAAVDTSNLLDVHVVEPDKSQHQRIDDLFRSEKFGMNLLTIEFPEGGARFDLVIIATNANVRRKIFDEISKRYEVQNYVLEKIVFQRLDDFEAVSARLKNTKSTAFVNCGRRTFPGYKMILERLKNERPINVTIKGSQFALASNGVHFLDLAEYLNGAKLKMLSGESLEKKAIDSKRQGYVEVNGTLAGKLDNDAKLEVSCHEAAEFSLSILLEGQGTSVDVLEASGKALLNHKGDTETLPFITRHVSGLNESYSNLLFHGHCDLTPFNDSMRQHTHFISALRSHLKLSNEEDETCPIS